MRPMAPGTVTLCGSLSMYPVGLGRAMHEAGHRALGLPYVLSLIHISEPTRPY